MVPNINFFVKVYWALYIYLGAELGSDELQGDQSLLLHIIFSKELSVFSKQQHYSFLILHNLH